MPFISSLFIVLLAQSFSAPAGARLEARLESPVKSATSKIGDAVTAVITGPIRAETTVALPGGSRLNGRVETVAAATDATEGRVRLVFNEIELPDGRRIATWITNSFSASAPNRNRRYIIYTAAGAIAGAFVGGKSARVAGVLGGTLIGFVIAGNSGDGKRPDLTLKTGAKVQLQLGQDMTIP